MYMVRVVPARASYIVVTLPGSMPVNLNRIEAIELRLQLDEALKRAEES